MILDRLQRASLYRGISPGLDRALDYLLSTDFTTIDPGRYPIDGEEVYARVLQITTKPVDGDAQFEAHRDYIDVQFVIDGIEQMGYADLDTLIVSQDYNPEKDTLMLKGRGDFFTVPAGYFAIFWPTDAHMPGMAVDSPQQEKKVVVKVKA